MSQHPPSSPRPIGPSTPRGLTESRRPSATSRSRIAPITRARARAVGNSSDPRISLHIVPKPYTFPARMLNLRKKEQSLIDFNNSDDSRSPTMMKESRFQELEDLRSANHNNIYTEWTNEEDEVVFIGITRYGMNAWKSILNAMQLIVRCKACRNINDLNERMKELEIYPRYWITRIPKIRNERKENIENNVGIMQSENEAGSIEMTETKAVELNLKFMKTMKKSEALATKEGVDATKKELAAMEKFDAWDKEGITINEVKKIPGAALV